MVRKKDDSRLAALSGMGDNQSGSTRRSVLALSALLGAGALGSVGGVTGESHGDSSELSDIDILNFALTLEYLEARFYREGLNTIGEDDLRNSDPLTGLGPVVQDRVYGDLRDIQEHEEIHVDVLDDTIEDLGGDPIEEPSFDFGTTTEDPAEFLQTAALLETTGVGAYAGAAPLIENPDLIPPALSIHSVEARHSSFLNVLNGEIGFPDAFDESLSVDTVLDRAGPFIEDDGTGDMAGGSVGTMGTQDEHNGLSDIEILNFARTLEFLEARFYREGLDTIGRDGLENSALLMAVGGDVRDRAYDDLRVIQDHEEIHVDVLGDTIEDLGGDPIDEPNFDFGTATENPAEFIQTAALLETTGVGAYAGAAPQLSNPDLIPPALSIHSVEARHTSFLNLLMDESGFPNAFDEALSVDTVLDRAGPFIVEEAPDADMYWQIDFAAGEVPPDPPAYWPDDIMASLGNSDQGATNNPSHRRQESMGQLDDVTIEDNAFAFDDPNDPGEVSVSFTVDDDGASRYLHLALFKLPGPFTKSEIVDQKLLGVVNDEFSGGDSGELSLELPAAAFRTDLSGDYEVPAVDTDAQGQAVFQLNESGDELSYQVLVDNIENVVSAHIHCAPAGENGPVGVTLFSGGPTSDSGILADGMIMEPDDGNDCDWETLDDVIDAINSGYAYVNVHTTQNPAGEIRGQIY